ncbi:MAG TPA: hypothetical protein VGL81_21705 [Polyangiaceae bacterium]|jgi:hypothetical protein
MPSLTHDALLQLFRNRPTLAPELLRDVLHAPVPAFDHVRIGDTTLSEVVPTEYRADLVLVLEGTGGDGPAAALVVEAQLARDADKRWSWPAYLASLRARLRCDVALLVVAVDAAVATWAGMPIATGHPGWVLAPLVLGPQAVPVVRDAAGVGLAPELAVLSVMLHGHGHHALAVAEAALAASRGLEDERAKLYVDLVFASVDEAARAILEALMASGNYEYQSDFARRYVAQGKAEGLARAVLTVLAARGLDVPEDLRARITACTDLAQLDAWLSRAATAASAVDVVRE